MIVAAGAGLPSGAPWSQPCMIYSNVSAASNWSGATALNELWSRATSIGRPAISSWGKQLGCDRLPRATPAALTTLPTIESLDSRS